MATTPGTDREGEFAKKASRREARITAFHSEWDPLIGPIYVRRLLTIRRLVSIGIVQLIFFLLVIIGWNALFARSATTSEAVVANGVFVIAAVSTILVGLVQNARLQVQMAKALRKMGLPVRIGPDVRGTAALGAWCARENVTNAQLIEAGLRLR